ncbi:MAG: LEPR-XLL domain-containing protein [Candidatus Accumulibacter sp.]|uniref:LEPR-XLL domain-containing protein n=1 Tax=Candidatus Accumulibacter affinis TaxID=2954384 RepID=A0A935W650_9PROT|nr:LEPR-XLL domain-containing protein [Candidatus Accumulibacter affinis]
MSRTSQNSHADSRRIGSSILARIPAACRSAFDTLGLAGRSKSAAPPFARKILFEALEPRLLLSADLNPGATSLTPQDQSSNDFAVSSTLLSLSDDPATSGLAVVRVNGPQEPGSDSWRLDLKQGDVTSPSVDTLESNASGKVIATNDGPGDDDLISHQEVLQTGAYYVQVRPSGEGAASGPYELLGERTDGIQAETDNQVSTNILADANPLALASEVDGPTITAAQFSSVSLANWVGGSGNWSDPTHWDIGVVPNNTEDTSYQVVLDVDGTPTITLDQDVSISSLTNAETLVVAGVSVNVELQTDNSGSIQLLGATAQLNLSGTVDVTGEISATAGTLNLSNATVTVDGSSAQVTADSAATLDSVSLYAANGGLLSLLGASTFTSGSSGNTIQASGAASKIELSGLSSLVGGSSGATQITALSDGEVTLSGDVQGYTAWTLDETGGTINASGVTSLFDAAVNVSGGAVLTFSTATTLSRDTFTALAGGEILFPVATSYTGYNYGDTAIEASGAGSWIDLSSLATFYGGGEYSDSHGYGHYYTTYVNALAGGKGDLAGAVSHRNVITVDGAESVLGVAGITKLGGTVLTINTPGNANLHHGDRGDGLELNGTDRCGAGIHGGNEAAKRESHRNWRWSDSVPGGRELHEERLRGHGDPGEWGW